MKKLWFLIGRIITFLLWPIIYVLLRRTTRTRLLLIADDHILLTRGWLNMGQWSLPGGGIHRDEAVVSGVIRELLEETGIAINASQLKKLGEGLQMTGFRYQYVGFVSRVPHQVAIKRTPIDIAESKWVAIQDLPNYRLQEHVLEILGFWQKRR